MQWPGVLFTTLLPHILAENGFMPMTASRTDAGAFGPQLATPQTLFDGRDAVKDLASRETCDDLDNLSRTGARHRLHQKMARIFVGANLSKDHLIPLSDVEADVLEHDVDCCVKDDPSILRWTHNRGKQGRNVVPFMPIVAHASDHITTAKAEASFEESDPRN
jgi:hypothetical protein